MSTKYLFKSFIPCVLVMLWGGFSVLQAQTPEDGVRLSTRALGTGARMIGLGTQGFGGVGDYGALYGNPAGLGLVKHSSVTGTLHAVRTLDESGSYSSGFDARNITQSTGGISLGNLALLYKLPTVQGSMVLGLGFNQVASFDRELRFEGMNTGSTISTSFLPFREEYALSEEGGLAELSDFVFPAFNGGFFEFFPEFLEQDPEAYPFLEAVIPGTEILQRGRVTDSGRMNEASFGGSIEVSRGLHVGAALNLAFGSYAYRSTFTEEDIYNQNGDLDYNVLQDDGTLLLGFHQLRYKQHINSDLLGFNVRMGVAKDITSSIRVGLAIESPARISIEESYGASFETNFDDGGVLTYGDRSDDVGNGVYEYRLHTPWRFGLGVAAEFGIVTLFGDIQVVDWSLMRFSGGDQQYFDELNDQIADNYQETGTISLGMEVELGRVVLRGGLAVKEDPLTMGASDSDGVQLQGEQYHSSAGVGFELSPNFMLDIGWAMGKFDSGYTPYPVDSHGQRQDAILHIDESVTRHQVVIGASYTF